jgi:hypothetical protein
MKAEFGWTSALFAWLGGHYVLGKIRKEEERLGQGWTYEPPTFYEVNDAVLAEDSIGVSRCSFITPNIGRRPDIEEDDILKEVGCA